MTDDQVQDNKDNNNSQPITPSSAVTAMTTPASGGGTGGFFSLGGGIGTDGSSIAELAKRLKEEKETNGKGSGGNGVGNVGAAVSGGGGGSGGDKDGDEDDHDDLHLFDSLYVYNQVEEKDNAFFKSLVHGFRSLRKVRDAQRELLDENDDNSQEEKTDNYCYVTVNFIDPTTKTVTTTSSSPSPTSAGAIAPPTTPKPTSILQQQSMFAKAMSSSGSLGGSFGTPGSSAAAGDSGNSRSSTPLIEDVFEKLTYIFERDYQSTLRSVQYKNIRTGEMDLISSLPVQPVLSRTGGVSPSSPTNANKGIGMTPKKSVHLPWGGAASTAIIPASDPSEWHTGPFCHVYIAACENTEHYRTKVKPSLQAFVSQLESVASNTAGNQQGGHSAEYMIVYIPIGGSHSTGTTTPDASNGGATNTPSTSTSNATTRRSGSFGSRFQKARQRAFGATTTGAASTDEEDAASRGSFDSDNDGMGSSGRDSGDDLESGVTVALHLLSRQERSLYKKIAADFPNGKVCVLSPVSLDRSDEDLANSEGVAIRTQEWNTFNRVLGSVIVGGFKDRCRRYKDELKRLDAQRATAATAAKGHGKGKPSPYAFNLCHFFLVKESLAFSFEQMQLPAEALLQYDEFRLYMPDLSDKDERKVRRSRRKSKALAEDGDSFEPTLTQLADMGAFLGFRKKIRTEFDLTPILDIIRRYLFAREMTLLFRMQQPVELLTRAQAFVKIMYSVMLRGISELSIEEQDERRTNAAKWVVQFIWDIKMATDIYFSTADDHSDAISVDTLNSDAIDHVPVEKVVASKVSDLLELSRLMLLKLGDTELVGGNPLRTIQQKLPDDLRQPWEPWTASAGSNIGAETAQKASLTRLSMSTNISSERDSVERRFILSSALASNSDFEETYHDLCMGIVRTSRKAKRRRCAARLQAEIGEYYIRKGDLVSAASLFKSILKVYKLDQWDRLHFWRLFRLAYCQRTIAEPSDYLKTLVSCFTPRLTISAPLKALNALQDDLEAVLGHPSIAEARYGKLAFIETAITVHKASMDVTSIGDGVERKQVMKRFCAVGESLQVRISITSNLPRTIMATSVKLFVLSFGDFASIFDKGDSIEEEDATKVMALDNPVKIEPGENNFEFEWTPSSAGQYILSTVEFKWLQGYFYYDSIDLPPPLIQVDVLPSEPSHSISIHPGYLVHGHNQEVEIAFDAGSDIITSGKLVLTCSEGLSIMPPGQDLVLGEWRQAVEVELKPCKPGEKYVLKAPVRCGLVEKSPNESSSHVDSADTTQGLCAKAFTSYLNSVTTNSDDSSAPNSMKTVIESFIPVLEASALSVESIEYHWLEPNSRLILFTLLASNTPYHFSFDGWTLTLPAPLVFDKAVDLNGHLLQSVISDGDRLSLAFECIVLELNDESHISSPQASPTLSLQLGDETGQKFPLSLSLDLSAMYSSIERNVFMTGTPVGATLKLESNDGTIGEPVTMTYSLDVPDPIKLEKLDVIYSVALEESPWVVAGQTSGILKMIEQLPNISFEVVGVPTIFGFLDQFPSLSLEVVKSDGSTLPLLVDMRYPEQFLSVPPRAEVTAVAYRSSTK